MRLWAGLCSQSAEVLAAFEPHLPRRCSGIGGVGLSPVALELSSYSLAPTNLVKIEAPLLPDCSAHTHWDPVVLDRKML